jgi:LmbE family N-acetylglucosaminyl deacetylase
MWRAAAMVEFQVGSARQPLRRILCLGSHCDDIEIGCGGTILRLLRENPGIEVYWKVFSSTPVRKKEAVRGAKLFLEAGKKKKVAIHKYRDRFFPSYQAQIKGEFDKLKKEFAPDVVLTHYRHDLHQDHRVICELTWNTFRSHLILEYEIPKYDGDLGTPNFFVGLDRATCERKAEHILEAFASQRDKQWFTADTFMALQRLRGIESNSPGGYAEGFHCRKLVL